MSQVKVIPTIYRGVWFRSRLEATWAVFFDACGVDWEYEPEGFVLSDGTWYLPDFLLHKVKDYGDLYIEVKGKLTKEDIHKVKLFSQRGNFLNDPTMVGFTPIAILGPIPRGNNIQELLDDLYFRYEKDLNIFYGEMFTRRYASLGFIDHPLFINTYTVLPGLNLKREFCLGCSEYEKDLTYRAYQRALSAKFEHGQTPLTTPIWEEGE